jgi:molybdopterin molybdotransferase
VLLSGGVSVGDHDQIKPALKQLGIEPDLWRVKVKPGKPFLFASRQESARTAHLRPAGQSGVVLRDLPAVCAPRLAQDDGRVGDMQLLPRLLPMPWPELMLENPGDRPHYLRGTLTNGRSCPFGLQQSHALLSLSRADALLRLEAGQTCKQAMRRRRGCWIDWLRRLRGHSFCASSHGTRSRHHPPALR